MRPSNQFLIHQTVHPSNPYLSNLERRMLWGTHEPFLLFFASVAKFSSFLGLPDPIPTNWAASLYSSQVTCPCLHCLCSSLLPFSLTNRSQLSHAGLLPSLPDFLHLGTESSCALWKASLKICQLCSAPLSLRTISQGVLLTNSLKSWKRTLIDRLSQPYCDKVQHAACGQEALKVSKAANRSRRSEQGVSNSLGNNCVPLQKQKCVPQPRLAINSSNSKPTDRGFLLSNTGGKIMGILPTAALNPFIPQPVLIPGVAPTQVQDFALGLVEPHEVHMGPLLDHHMDTSWTKHTLLYGQEQKEAERKTKALGRQLQSDSTADAGWKPDFVPDNEELTVELPCYFSPTTSEQLGLRLNHFPGQPVPVLDNPFSEVKFPNIQSKPPLAQLEAISSCPITCYLGEETDPHLSTTSCQ
ncbi:hypothetical protein QYF61_026437, partial [Mycteria americana]